ncbi:hypothetical protein GEMRC1_005562 [Eukaryota sp. GEM-RC1]
MSSTLSSYNDSETPVHSSILQNGHINRFIPLACNYYESKLLYGNVFGPPFLHLLLIMVTLLPLLVTSGVALVDLTIKSSSLTFKSFLSLFLSTNDVNDIVFITSCALCLFLCFTLPCFLMGIGSPVIDTEDVHHKLNHIKCLQSFDAMFYFNWNNIAKRDVVSSKCHISTLLQSSLERGQSPDHDIDPTQPDNVGSMEGKVLNLLSFLLILIISIVSYFFFSGSFVLFDSYLNHLTIPLLVCLFNVLDRKLLYYLTSVVPVLKRDSRRVFHLVFFQLCFLFIPMLALNSVSECFITDVGYYIFYLVLLTFFFDAIFPFVWYKLRSLSKSFEKPLFDLPLSQAKVFYYHVLSFTAQFYVPTFAIISFPLVYLYGKYLSYSLRKCSRLPSSTYTMDHMNVCFIKSGTISFLCLLVFFYMSLVNSSSCSTFHSNSLTNFSIFTTPMVLFTSLYFGLAFYLVSLLGELTNS